MMLNKKQLFEDIKSVFVMMNPSVSEESIKELFKFINQNEELKKELNSFIKMYVVLNEKIVPFLSKLKKTYPIFYIQLCDVINKASFKNELPFKYKFSEFFGYYLSLIKYSELEIFKTTFSCEFELLFSRKAIAVTFNFEQPCEKNGVFVRKIGIFDSDSDNNSTDLDKTLNEFLTSGVIKKIYLVKYGDHKTNKNYKLNEIKTKLIKIYFFDFLFRIPDFVKNKDLSIKYVVLLSNLLNRKDRGMPTHLKEHYKNNSK